MLFCVQVVFHHPAVVAALGCIKRTLVIWLLLARSVFLLKSDLSFVREEMTEKFKVTRGFRSLRVFSGTWRKRACFGSCGPEGVGSRRAPEAQLAEEINVLKEISRYSSPSCGEPPCEGRLSAHCAVV